MTVYTTLNERPTVVGAGRTLVDSVTDEHPSRPAIVVLEGGRVKCRSIKRTPTGAHSKPTDPGVDKLFDGQFLPALKFSLSHHDLARACIVGLGSVDIDVTHVTGDVCVLLLPNPDGSYGKGSRVRISRAVGFRMGVLVAGQEDFTIEIGESRPSLAEGEPNGHTYYANECYSHNGQFLRARWGTVRINRNICANQPLRALDHSTVKMKGSHGTVVTTFYDDNPCGHLDSFDSSGVVVCHKWKGARAGGRNFQAFRVSTDADKDKPSKFGLPPARLCVLGDFDCTSSNAGLPSFRLQTKDAAFGGCRVKSSSDPEVYGVADAFGIHMDEPISE